MEMIKDCENEKINKDKHLLSDKESDMQINKYRVTDNRKGKKNC